MVGIEKGKNEKKKNPFISRNKKRLTIDKSLINSALNCSFVHLCCTGGVLKVSISMESLLSTTQKRQIIIVIIIAPLVLSVMTCSLLTIKEPNIYTAPNKIKANQIKTIFRLLMKWAKPELLGKGL